MRAPRSERFDPISAHHLCADVHYEARLSVIRMLIITLGALVSLVHNRGTTFRNPDPSFTEMHELSNNMASKRFPVIPANIRSMERLWSNKPKFKGIVIGREAEAALFEIGLDSN